MSKYFIIGIAFILIFSVIFGFTYDQVLQHFGGAISSVSNTVLGILDGLTIFKFDFVDKVGDSVLVDYKYANFGSVDSLDYGHIDKAKFIGERFFPKFYHDSITNFSCVVKMDPYYNDISYEEYIPAPDDMRVEVRSLKNVIHYKISITVGDLMFDMYEPSNVGTFDYHVYVVDDVTRALNGYRYIITYGDTFCYFGEEFNNVYEYVYESNIATALISKHQYDSDNMTTFFSRTPTELISNDSTNNIFEKFIPVGYSKE